MTGEFVRSRNQRLEGASHRGRVPRIEVGSVDMACMLSSDLRCYVPTLGGSLLQTESGITQNSIDNIHDIAFELGAPLSIRAFRGELFEFWFPGSEWYVATGFGVGYSGVGPAGLADIIVEFLEDGSDKSRAVVLGTRRAIARYPRDHTGPVWRYLGRHNRLSTKTWLVDVSMGNYGSRV